MSATGSQAASRKRKEPAEMVKAEDADAAQVLEPQHAMPEMQRPGYAHPQVEYSRYFPMPQGFLNHPNGAPLAGNLVADLTRHAEDAIRWWIDHGTHLGELMADAGKASNSYGLSTLNKQWLDIVYYGICDRVFTDIRYRFPGIGSTLVPFQAGAWSHGQDLVGYRHAQTHFLRPAPPGFFNYSIDIPVPIGYIGRLHYSGATAFQAGTAFDPMCSFTLATGPGQQ